jgi:hypothetical protein
MKKNILVVAAVTLFWVTGCDQKASTNASADQQATTADVTSDVAHNTVHNPNTTNPEEIASTDAPTMTFKETEHDFGSLKDGEVVKHTFTFTNTGKSPLVIESASSTCGCTVPEVPKGPIAPGAEGKIEVQFDSRGKGGQQVLKVISIKANTQPEITQVNIKANVKPSPGANGPLRS